MTSNLASLFFSLDPQVSYTISQVNYTGNRKLGFRDLPSPIFCTPPPTQASQGHGFMKPVRIPLRFIWAVPPRQLLPLLISKLGHPPYRGKFSLYLYVHLGQRISFTVPKESLKVTRTSSHSWFKP